MEDLRIRYYTPITTGSPHVSRPTGAGSVDVDTREQAAENTTFRQALEEQLGQLSSVEFSKHAVTRVIERKLDLDEDSIARLNEGVRLAGEKRLEDPLILVDATAFLVNIKHNKVITTVAAEELKGNVFTNIDGTVII